MNWHSEDIWGNRKHSGSEYGLWGQTVQAHIPAPPSSDELSLAVREGNLSQLHLYNEDDSQIEKDKYQMITYKWIRKKKKMIKKNVFTKQKQTHRHRKQAYGYQRGK